MGDAVFFIDGEYIRKIFFKQNFRVDIPKLVNKGKRSPKGIFSADFFRGKICFPNREALAGGGAAVQALSAGHKL
jgi:hypothetical protein